MSKDDPREAMERYRAGEMDAQEKARFQGEILADDGLSDELYDDVSLETSLAESARRPSSRIPRIALLWVPVAAAALILLSIQLRTSPLEEPPVLRGSGVGVELIAPLGEVESPPQLFRWRRHLEAASYRFELLDLQAQPLLQVVVVDTLWAPADGDPAPPAQGSWHVTPLDEFMMELGEGASAAYHTKD